MNHKQALKVTQTCIRQKKYRVTRHFQERLEERVLFWPDVLSVIAHPQKIHEDGLDDLGREKWIISGEGSDQSDLDIVIVIDQHDDGNVSIFVTIYYA